MAEFIHTLVSGCDFLMLEKITQIYFVSALQVYAAFYI